MNKEASPAVKPKAKRKLKSMDFSGDNAAVALVGPLVGGAANGTTTLLYKSKLTQEQIEKMQSIKVEMTIPEFLERFFNLYGSDAEVLARLMGYVAPASNMAYDPQPYEDYIQEKLNKFEVIKALNSDINKLNELSGDELIAYMQDQLLLEGVIKQALKEFESEANLANEDNTSVTREVEQEVLSSKTNVTKGKRMTTEINQEANVEQVANVETVEKSALVAVQKALEEKEVQLQKALDSIAQFEAEKKEQVVKAKSDKVKALVQDKAVADIVVKASLSLESEDDFAAFLSAIQAMQATVTTETMFMEKGVSTPEETTVTKSALERMLEAKYSK